MNNSENIKIVLSTLRYKSAPELDQSLRIPFIQNFKEIIEFDRTIDIGLEQVFYDERQKSTKFRPSSKFQIIFENGIGGSSNYAPFENNLYYVNSKDAAQAQCKSGTTINWSGLPQYNEFDFIRNDYNVLGYTQPSGVTNQCHVVFEPQSASTYNWNFFISYPFSSDTNQTMQIVFQDDPLSSFTWICGDGIPFIIKRIVIGGNNLISFKCPMKHNLSLGESVELSLTYDGQNIFPVYSFGLEDYSNTDFVFNIYDIGFTGNTFEDLVKGTFKRIIDSNNVNDTISKYYVRKHKLLTNTNDAVLVKAGFENNIFGTKKKYESSGFTPDNKARVSIKEGSQSYTLSFNSDIDIINLLDNQKRPITELFFTTIWKGYFGWTFGEKKLNNIDYQGLQKGWLFNLPSNSVTLNPTSWWNIYNGFADTQLPVGTYTNLPFAVDNVGNPIIFTYIESLKEGDILDGDFCEWNDYTQNERIISELYHKFKFNPIVFNTNDKDPKNKIGYYYQPHTPITLRVYSDYIESGNPVNIVDVPFYSHYSTSVGEFIWRDIYDYGYIDSKNRGVNYPFLNGVHYPFKNIIFKIIPEGTNYSEQNIIFEPIIDFCE